MKKKIVILGVLLIVALGGFVYFTRNNDNIETSLTIKNETKEKFEAVGILLDNKVILNKINSETFTMPKKLTSGINEVSVIAITTDNKILKSRSISLKDNKEISIKEIKDNIIKLNIDGEEKTFKEFDIPELNEWKIEPKGNMITATFKANTNANYTLYVWGKGGKLGISGTLSDNDEVVASWQKPKNKVGSWIVFTK